MNKMGWLTITVRVSMMLNNGFFKGKEGLLFLKLLLCKQHNLMWNKKKEQFLTTTLDVIVSLSEAERQSADDEYLGEHLGCNSRPHQINLCFYRKKSRIYHCFSYAPDRLCVCSLYEPSNHIFVDWPHQNHKTITC